MLPGTPERVPRHTDTERYALKALRGGSGPIDPGPHSRNTRASHALPAARLWTGRGSGFPAGSVARSW